MVGIVRIVTANAPIITPNVSAKASAIAHAIKNRTIFRMTNIALRKYERRYLNLHKPKQQLSTSLPARTNAAKKPHRIGPAAKITPQKIKIAIKQRVSRHPLSSLNYRPGQPLKRFLKVIS